MGGCLCLSQHSSLQAFHCHVVRLSSPSPSSSPLSLVIFQSRCTPLTRSPSPHPNLRPPPPLHPTLPHPCALCQVTRLVCSDGTEEEMKAQSPLLTHACSACRVQSLLFFSPCRFPALMMACNYIRIYICSVLARGGGKNSLRKGFS